MMGGDPEAPILPQTNLFLHTPAPRTDDPSTNYLPTNNLPAALVAGPIIGTRLWRLYRAGTFADHRPQVTTPWRLHSLTTNTLWPPMFPMIATCEYCHDHDRLPTPHCACGLFAMIPPHLPEFISPLLSHTTLVRGSVALWGRVIRHEYGYRAQYAYPLSLTIRVGPLPPGFPGRASLEAIRSALATDYGCPVTLG